MKLIIEIGEELYEACKGKPPVLCDAEMDMIAQAIANGILYDEKEQADAFWRRLYGTESEVKNES